jgi:hypothetical protein
MNLTFREALEQLASGNPVAREAWPPEEGDEYLEPEFDIRSDMREFPYVASDYGVLTGGRFRIAKYNTDGRVGVYEPTEEDKQAKDWYSC